MNIKMSAMIALLSVIALSACNPSKSTDPDAAPAPSAQTNANTNQPEAQADQALQAQGEDQKQQNEQASALQQAVAEPQEQPAKPEVHDDESIFAIESADDLKKLIAEGANVNLRNEDGQTVLWDIDLDFVDHKTSDYTKAIEIAKILIDAGLDLNAKDKDGKTAMFNMTLDAAAEPYIKLLLEHGADAGVVAKDGTTVLFSAVEVCAPNIIKVLIDAGADVNAKNKNGKTYLGAADESCRNKLISELKLSPKAAMSEEEIQKILSKMNVKPGDVNKLDGYGNTPLFYADTADEANALIAAGANVNYQTKDKDTPLFAAVREDNTVVAKILIDAGANVNATNEFYQTPLFDAKSAEMVNVLVKGGADIYHVDDHETGGTARDHMKYLLENDHDINREKLNKAIDALNDARHGDDNFASAPVVPTPADANMPSGDTINPSADTEEKKVQEVSIPPATGEVICTKWNNDLFVDGSELYYKIKMTQPAENQEGEENTDSESEFYVMCHVRLDYATDIYCGSSVTCELEPKYNTEQNQKVIASGLPMEGTWFIDQNGIYHFDKDQFKGLVKTSDTGKCKRVRYVRYINCESGTLAWEYEPFTILEPLIPLGPDVKVYETSDWNGIPTKKTVSRTGTVLCYHYGVDGSNPTVDDICVDDTKGPSSFKTVRNGESKYTMKGSLRTKSKK